VQPDLNSDVSGLEDETKLFELVLAMRQTVGRSLQTGVERSDSLDDWRSVPESVKGDLQAPSHFEGEAKKARHLGYRQGH
jgi:hypothetical protein